MFFDVSVLFLFLLEQLRSVLLEPAIDVLQAVDQDVEFNVLSLDQLLRHLQAIDSCGEKVSNVSH